MILPFLLLQQQGKGGPQGGPQGGAEEGRKTLNTLSLVSKRFKTLSCCDGYWKPVATGLLPVLAVPRVQQRKEGGREGGKEEGQEQGEYRAYLLKYGHCLLHRRAWMGEALEDGFCLSFEVWDAMVSFIYLFLLPSLPPSIPPSFFETAFLPSLPPSPPSLPPSSPSGWPSHAFCFRSHPRANRSTRRFYLPSNGWKREEGGPGGPFFGCFS